MDEDVQRAQPAQVAIEQGCRPPRSARSSDPGDAKGRSQSGARAPECTAYSRIGTAERSAMEQQLSQAKSARLSREMAAQFAVMCPFQPRINRRATFGNAGASRCFDERSSLQQLPVEERLLKHMEIQQAKREEAEAARCRDLAEEERRQFRPRVNRKSDYRKVLKHPDNISVEERLLHYGRNVEESLRYRQQQRERSEAEQVRNFFRPSAIKADKKTVTAFLDRNDKFVKEREQAIQRARSAELRQCVAKPTICSLSASLVELNRQRDHGAGRSTSSERGKELYEKAMWQLKEKERRRAEQMSEEARREYYQPAINPRSVSYIQTGHHGALFKQDFVERQEEYQRVKEEHERCMSRALEQERKREFSRSQSASAAISSGPAVQDRIEEQVNRLYYERSEISREAKRRLEEKLLLQQCTFQPIISPGSTVVAAKLNREKDVVKRLTEPRLGHPKVAGAPTDLGIRATSSSQTRDTKRDAVASSGEPHRSEENPAIGGDRSVNPVDRKKADRFYQRQMSALQRKELNLKKIQCSKEVEELLECTFRPRTRIGSHDSKPVDERRAETPPTERKKSKPHSSPHESSTMPMPIENIAGVDLYLKRQEDARRRQQEQQERYNSLGKGMPLNGPSFTVIEPFRLSHESRGRKSRRSPGPESRSTSRESYSRLGQETAGCSLELSGHNGAVSGGERQAIQSKVREEHLRPRLHSETTAVALVGPRRAKPKISAAQDGHPRRSLQRDRDGFVDPFNSEGLLASLRHTGFS